MDLRPCFLERELVASEDSGRQEVRRTLEHLDAVGYTLLVELAGGIHIAAVEGGIAPVAVDIVGDRVEAETGHVGVGIDPVEDTDREEGTVQVEDMVGPVVADMDSGEGSFRTEGTVPAGGKDAHLGVDVPVKGRPGEQELHIAAVDTVRVARRNVVQLSTGKYNNHY